MGEIRWEVEVKDERTVTAPVPLDENNTEQLGKFLVMSAQDGYSLKSVSLLTEEKGTQRDPYRVTRGVQVKVAK